MEYKKIPFEEIKGKIIKKISISKDKSIIKFLTDKDIEYQMYHDQICCEDVYLDDVDNDINLLLNSPILIAEETTNYTPPTISHNSFTWSFYRLGTINGVCVFRWYGTSNGCYSEEADVYEIIKYTKEDLLTKIHLLFQNNIQTVKYYNNILNLINILKYYPDELYLLSSNNLIKLSYVNFKCENLDIYVYNCGETIQLEYVQEDGNYNKIKKEFLDIKDLNQIIKKFLDV